VLDADAWRDLLKAAGCDKILPTDFGSGAAPEATPDEASVISPGLASAAVFLDGNGLDAIAHAIGVEAPVQVVDLVTGQPREARLEDCDHLLAVEPGVLDLQPERPRDQAAYVEEAKATFVLLVGLG
jgi:hypothetical protein